MCIRRRQDFGGQASRRYGFGMTGLKVDGINLLPLTAHSNYEILITDREKSKSSILEV
jgi:hypothetical protein